MLNLYVSYWLKIRFVAKKTFYKYWKNTKYQTYTYLSDLYMYIDTQFTRLIFYNQIITLFSFLIDST